MHKLIQLAQQKGYTLQITGKTHHSKISEYAFELDLVGIWLIHNHNIQFSNITETDFSAFEKEVELALSLSVGGHTEQACGELGRTIECVKREEKQNNELY